MSNKEEYCGKTPQECGALVTCVSDLTRMECISDPRFKISILWYMLTDSQCGLVGEAR